MKVVRSGTVLVTLAALGIAGTVIIKQQMRIESLKDSCRSLQARYQELSAANVSLLSVDAARKEELIGLRQQASEVLRLRNQLALSRQQLAAADAKNQNPRAEGPDQLAAYVTKEQMRFAGLDTPENAFQSLNWAAVTGDYTNWLAALSPACQKQELANPKSLEDFRRRSIDRTAGMQVLATKPIGSDRIELKVRLDTENAVSVLIFPMVAIGNEWRLGDDIHSYTQTWDSPGAAQ
jgi:hypothetical protein